MKRILSLCLCAALLVAFATVCAVRVKAESAFTVSEQMLEVLKKWEGFSAKPYWDYKQWTVGYGTRVPDGKLAEYQENGISEEEAEILLMEFMNDMGKELNEFNDQYDLGWNQAQFDALLSLTFNCGSSWLYKPSTLRSAITEGWEGDDLIFALAQWSNAGNATSTGLVRRRLAEAEIYLNGVYSSTPPANYCYVLFNANGGESEIVVQGYDTGAVPEIRALPTYEDFVFEGWYTDPTGGEKITNLDVSVKGYTLYAHWSAGSGENAPKDDAAEIGGKTVNYDKQVATGVLHAFRQPVKGALVLAAYPNGEVLKIVAEYTDAAGTKWGQVSGGGWVNLAFTQDFSESSDEEGTGVKVTVTASAVNLRRGPNTTYAVVGSVDTGDVLEITRTATGGGYTWGKCSKGWIALKYTNYDSVVNGDPDTDEDPGDEDTKPEEDEDQPAQEETPVATGKVKLQSGFLNVRSGPNTGYGVVGRLTGGETVKILETKTVGTAQWGRTEKGWICLTYVQLDGEEQTPEEKPGEEDKPQESKPNEDTQPDEGKQPEQDQHTAVTGKVVISSGKLNIRKEPGTGSAVVGWLTANETVTITEQKTVDGMNWGKTDKGWVSMDYISIVENEKAPEEEKDPEAETVIGIVSADGNKLRVRTGPGSEHSVAAYLNDGAEVTILEQKTVNGTVWGRIEKGWISLNFVQLKGTQEDTGSQEQETTALTGTVKATTLHVRSGAGTGNKIVGRLYNGEKVTVLETKDVDGITWGRIATGWICMDYVTVAE